MAIKLNQFHPFLQSVNAMKQAVHRDRPAIGHPESVPAEMGGLDRNVN